MSTTKILFTLLVALVGLQRLVELRVSRRNEEALIARGGRRHADRQLVWMRALHAGWLVAMPLEVWLADRSVPFGVTVAALLVFGLGQWLRLSARRALGSRWTVSVVTVPGERVVTKGIFGAIRHPNYVGVALEILALPLVHGAWVTAAVFSLLDAVLLRQRIRAEERALRRDADYEAAFEETGVLSNPDGVR